MKSQDLLRGGLNLTCNGFTSAVHIVRGVGLKDCSTQIRHMMHDCEYKPHEGAPGRNFFVCLYVQIYEMPLHTSLANQVLHLSGSAALL